MIDYNLAVYLELITCGGTELKKSQDWEELQKVAFRV
jgi:hypothetical protein